MEPVSSDVMRHPWKCTPACDSTNCCGVDRFRNPLVTPLEPTGALFWDRRRPRLHSSRLTDLSGSVGRRGRLRPQKSAPISARGVTKVDRLKPTYFPDFINSR